MGRSPTFVKPLPLGIYNNLARHLRDADMKPADLLDADGLRELDNSWHGSKTKQTLEDVHQLLGRGFLLTQALERWGARAIWVVTRADEDYPSRLKKKMLEKAPPVLYGCGDRRALDNGGLAVVGSRSVSDELIEYTERVGQLAAEAKVQIVSGGARGVDQAAMRGSLEAGGHAIGVLGNNLERAALNRGNREPLMDGRLVLVSSYDPLVRFRAWRAMERNKQIYALADAALVVNSDHGHGGTWAGATGQLKKLHYVPVHVRDTGEPNAGLEALIELGACRWPEPQTPEDLRRVLEDKSEPSTTAEPVQGSIFPELEVRPEVSGVRESPPTEIGEGTILGEPSASLALWPTPRKAAMRILRAMSGEMTRRDILATLGLRSWGNVKKRYVDPCRDQGWIDLTLPEKPKSPRQRFHVTAAGRAHLKAFQDQ